MRNYWKTLSVWITLLCLLGCNAHSQTVCTMPHGERYHDCECTYVRRAATHTERTLSEAQDKGYTPCLVCHPTNPPTPALPSPSTAPSNSQITRVASETPPPAILEPMPAPQKATPSVQCTGFTQAGNRCKRMTTNASGRCYQH